MSSPASNLSQAADVVKSAASSAATNVELAALTFGQKYWYWVALGTAVLGFIVGYRVH